MLCCLAGLLAVAEAAGQNGLRVDANLIRNPGFEELDGEGKLVGWANAFAQDGLVRSGQYAGQTTPGSGRRSDRDAGVYQTVSVKPNTTYRVSGWFCSSVSRQSATLGAWDEAQEDCLGSVALGWGNYHGWTPIELAFDSGDRTKVVVGFRIGTPGNRPELWLDDVEMVEAPDVRLGDLSADPPPREVSPDEKERGFVVFDRPWLERVSSTAKPGDGERTESLSLRLAPGEYEPLTVAVYALRDLARLNLALDVPLTGPDGRAIAPERVNIRSARMTRATLDANRWMELPMFLPPAEPVGLSADTTRLFWITVKAPEEAPAGPYEGSFLLTADNAGSQRIPVSVEVLPFRLLTPSVAYGMWFLPPEGEVFGPRGEERRARMYYEDMKAHGMTTIMGMGGPGGGFRWGYKPLNLSAGLGEWPSWNEQMQLLLDVGLPSAGQALFPWGLSKVWGAGPNSYELLIQHRRSGRPETQLYLFDEAGAKPELVEGIKWQSRGITHPDVRTMSTSVSIEQTGRLLDTWVQHIPISDATIRKARKWDRKLMAYDCWLAGASPVHDRYRTGFYTWRLGLNGMTQWSYRDGREATVNPEGEWTSKHMGSYVALSPDGPIPTVGWEAMREGIDDHRYLHTLRVMAEEAANDAPTRALADESFALLSDIEARIDPERAYEEYFPGSLYRIYEFVPQPEIRPVDYDRMRARVADQILKLWQKGVRATGEEPAAPVADETKPLSDGEKKLHQAVVAGDIEAVKRLVADKVDIDVRDETWHWTPLHRVAELGHAEIAALLLERGAKKDARDPQGWTPLQVAAENGRKPVAEMLMQAGAEPDPRDSRGRSPLMYAAWKLYTEVAELLLEAGADINAADPGGHSVLHWACAPFVTHRGHYPNADHDERADRMVRLLLGRGANVHAVDKDGRTALHWAARTVHPMAVRQLLQAGANPNARETEFGWTPLHWAVYMGPAHPYFGPDGAEAAKILLENGADADAADPDGRTPLHWTALMVGDHSATAALLLKHGAKVNVHDGEGNTPLHLAVIQRNVDLAKMLLENRADANARNGDGRTPLHLAVEQAEMAGLLLKQGADRELRDHDGKTPLNLAASAVGHVGSLGTRAEVRALLLKR